MTPCCRSYCTATAWAGLAYAILTLWVVALTVGAAWVEIVCLRVASAHDVAGPRMLAAGVGILLAAGVVVQGVLFWLPMGRYQPVGERAPGPEEEDLKRLVGQVAKEIGARPPARIVLTAEANAYASFHRGLPGVLAGDAKLTVGLPLLDGLEPDAMRAILAHELAHLRDVSAMRVCAIAFEIEGGLTRMTGYGSHRIRNWHLEKRRITVLSVAGLALATWGEQVAAALVAPVWGPCRRLWEHLVATMEFRADAVAARAVGAATVVDALESVGQLVAALANDGDDRPGARPDGTAGETAARQRAGRFRERKRREGRRDRSPQGSNGEDGLTRARIERLRTPSAPKGD